ncbi:putative short-chain dehydrogenase/reductase [Paraburkholderia hospita]|uniref:Short-chain dehydrogenase/reductase n=1 Tax=Paraburkholderia hospita TaxID=169430 RepID=A0ABN0FG35_9BURK|nr:SDR family oxidoreductase [Paraburkholderia hospita]EIM97552.1 putative short-chain dehydrogenase/reductase [Paraburkholderia hospita]OUL92478.1 short-chain dehydrogenase [Paraburkholderia hospita]
MNNHSTTSSHALTGKVALVTGGARGIGAEVCSQLAALGAHVVVAARDKTKAESMAAALRQAGLLASAVQFDVTREEDRQAALESLEKAHGKLDILINNAGIWLDSANAATPPDRAPSEAPPSVVRETFEANFFASIFVTQTLLPLLRRSDAGRIVNVSSIRGSLAHLSNPKSPVYPIKALGYDTSKAALNAFTILLAEELRGTRIKVNAIHPGWVRTTMGSEQADLDIADGARTTVQYATLGENGPKGGFFYLDVSLPW